MFGLLVSCAKVALLLIVSTWLLSGLLREPHRSWMRRRAIWIMPVIYTIAMLAPNIWVIFGASLLIIPVFAKRGVDVAALMPFALLGIPSISYDWRIAGAAIGTIDAWRCISISALLMMVLSQRKSLVNVPVGNVWQIVAFYLLSIIISIHGANLTTAFRGMLDTATLFLIPFIVTILALKAGAEIERIATAWIIAIALQAIIAIYQSHSYWPIYENIFWSSGIPLPKMMAFKMRAGIMRATGSLLESNSLAILIAQGTVLSLGLSCSFKSRSSLIFVAALMAIGIYSTVSRGGMVFLIVGWLAFEAYRGRWKAVGAAAMIVGIAYVSAMMASSIIPGLGAFTGSNADAQDTGLYRRQLFSRGVEEIARHPLFGQDANAVNISLADMRQGEGIIDFVNGYIYVGVYGGVGAVILLFAMFAGSAIQLAVIRRRLTTPALRDLAASCFAINCALIVTTFTSGFFGQAVMPYVIVIAFTGWLMSVASRRSAMNTRLRLLHS